MLMSLLPVGRPGLGNDAISLLHRARGAHHWKAGNSETLFATVCSATWTGYDSLASFSLDQVVDPLRQSTLISQPTVVCTRRLTPFLDATKASDSCTSFPSVRCPMISSIKSHTGPRKNLVTHKGSDRVIDTQEHSQLCFPQTCVLFERH